MNIFTLIHFALNKNFNKIFLFKYLNYNILKINKLKYIFNIYLFNKNYNNK